MYRRLATNIRALNNERGSVLTSLIFVFLAATFAMVLVSLAVSAATTFETTRTVANMNAAIDAKFNEHVADTNTGATPDQGESCYAAWDTCVTAVATTTTAGKTVTLVAAHKGGRTTTEQTRTLANVGGSHIAGFDAAGQPVWTTPDTTVGTRFTGTNPTGIVGGIASTCGLDTTGAAWCWGAEGIGDGTTTAKNKPAAVSGDRKYRFIATDITTPKASTCAIERDNNRPWCWGDNTANTLGVGAVGASTAQPVELTGTLALSTISMRDGTRCGLDVNGQAYCWGVNDHGQAGRDLSSHPDLTTPTLLDTTAQFKEIVVGGTSCAINNQDEVMCWGKGTVDPQHTPTVVSGTQKYSDLAVDAAGNMCALTSAGAVRCNTPLSAGAAPGVAFHGVSGGHQFTSVAVDAGTACAITTTRKLFCWGANTRGQVGAGDTNSRPTPVAVAAGTDFHSVSLRGGSVIALDVNRQGWAWGANTGQKLGVGSTATNVLTPTLLTGDHSFAAAAALPDRMVGATSRGDVSAWGANTGGVLGIGSATTATEPTEMDTPKTPVTYTRFSGVAR